MKHWIPAFCWNDTRYVKIIIVANGNLLSTLLPVITSGDFVIGVDRAAYWLLEQGITPDVAVGDFDSTSPDELREIKKRVRHVEAHSPEKDFTDTELAVRYALKQKPKELVIVGGVGSRVDHLLATIYLLDLVRKNRVRGYLIDERNRIQLVSRGRTILKRGEYPFVSLIPFTKTISVTLSGLKYPLTRKTIVRGQTLGISNEFAADEAIVDLHSGKALVIESND